MRRRGTMSVILGRRGGGRLRQSGMSSFMTPPGTRTRMMTPTDIQRGTNFNATTVGQATAVGCDEDSTDDKGLELNDV